MGGGKAAKAGGFFRGLWNLGGKGAAAVGSGVSATASGVGALGASGAAAGGFLVGLPLLGLWANDQMTQTEGGLRERIADRQARIKEYDQLLQLQREAGDRPEALAQLQAERAAMVATHDEMAQRLEELLTNTKVGGEIEVRVSSAPGLQTETTLKPSEGTRMRGNVGRTDGYQASW
jgi:Tfp pilus assembly protein PilN